MDDNAGWTEGQDAAAASAWCRQRLVEFLGPLLCLLDVQLDKRLVRTFVGLMEAIIKHRNRPLGLLLSELGGYLLAPAQAPAGTKRISNLLRSAHWTHLVISGFLRQRADAEVRRLEGSGETPLVIWDDSAWEKPESIASEGLCAVRSRKAARLKHIRPGFYTPPSGTTCVPGLQWLAVLVVGMRSVPAVASMTWWTKRGVLASDRRTEEGQRLDQCAQAWGCRVLHIFDRGYAGAPWLTCLAAAGVRFVIRWQTSFRLQDAGGQWQTPGSFLMHKRSWDSRQLWDYRRRDYRTTSVIATPVWHTAYPAALWLVVVRQKGRKAPWYLLTNEPVSSAEQAWTITLAYVRRWQIEWAFRYNKSELGIESPRLWFWDNRMKLLMIVTLVYAFLLHLLMPEWATWREWLLDNWARRTGKHVAQAHVPLYRLRAALSRLWLAFPPARLVLENSG